MYIGLGVGPGAASIISCDDQGQALEAKHDICRRW